MGRQQRTAPKGIRKALIERDGTCAFPGCRTEPARCHAHHVVEWANGGPTSLDNVVLRRHRGRVYVDAAASAVPTDWVCAWRGEAQVALPGDLGVIQFEPAIGAGLSLQRLHAEPTAIRPRSGGERMRLAHERPTRTLKNLLQESGVPQWRRDRLPLLFCANDLVWIPEVGFDCRYAAQEGEAAVVPHWLEPTS